MALFPFSLPWSISVMSLFPSFFASPSTDAEAVRVWIIEKTDETTMMDDLPKGPDEAPVHEADISAVRKFLDDLAVRINLAEARSKKRGRPSKTQVLES